jgi:hypothetical protein
MSVASDLAVRKAAEKRVEAELKDPTPGISAPAESAVTAGEQLAALDRFERKTVPGAPIRAPRQQLLDASAVQKEHPGEHVRWVNIRDPQKAESRQMEGYKRLTSEEGGRQIGSELALMAAPVEIVQARVDAERQLNREKLEAPKRMMEEAAEGIAKDLRDNHGMNIDPRRLFVNESQ